MKSQLLISFFIVLFGNIQIAKAQSYSEAELSQIKSYNISLADKTIDDTTRMITLYNLSEIIYVENMDTVTYMSNKILSIAEKMRAKKLSDIEKKTVKRLMANAYNNIGFVENYQGKVQLSLDYYLKSVKIKEEINDIEGLSTAYNNLGSVYSDEGDFEKSLNYYKKV